MAIEVMGIMPGRHPATRNEGYVTQARKSAGHFEPTPRGAPYAVHPDTPQQVHEVRQAVCELQARRVRARVIRCETHVP